MDDIPHTERSSDGSIATECPECADNLVTAFNVYRRTQGRGGGSGWSALKECCGHQKSKRHQGYFHDTAHRTATGTQSQVLHSMNAPRTQRLLSLLHLDLCLGEFVGLLGGPLAGVSLQLQREGGCLSE